jgi:hypothetical protein
MEMRTFDTGATRNTDNNKLDFEGFLSPLTIERYAQYLHKHRVQADGNVRDSDNWQRGIPLNVYMKSAWRHFHDAWKQHRGFKGIENLEDTLCGVLFNISGYLHELVKQRLETEKTIAVPSK